MKRPLLALLGLALCTAAVVAWTWGLYEVTRIGTCASGGPYVSARPCPEGTGFRIVAMILSIFGGLAGIGVYSAGRAAHGRAAAGLGVLMWFMLFVGGSAAMLLSAYGPAAPDDAPGGVAIFISILFVPMGVVPLLAALGFGSRRRLSRLKASQGVTGPALPGGRCGPRRLLLPSACRRQATRSTALPGSRSCAPRASSTRRSSSGSRPRSAGRTDAGKQ